MKSVARKVGVRDAQVLYAMRLQRAWFATPLTRAQWLVRFADLASATPAQMTRGERARLSDEILGFARTADQPQPPYRGPGRAHLGFTAEEIIGLARRLRDGMEHLAGGEMWPFALSGLPPIDAGLGSVRPGQAARRIYSGDARSVLIVSALDTLATEAHRLAKCRGPACGRLFVRTRLGARGACCSRRCSQRWRTARYRASMSREQWRERRHAIYVAKVRRERGPAFAKTVRRNQPIPELATE